MDSIRWTVNYTMSGFACQLEITTGDSAETMKKAAAALDYLQKHGAAPVAEPTMTPPAADGPPTCPVHGTSMKRSVHHPGYYCAKKNEDGSFCAEKSS